MRRALSLLASATLLLSACKGSDKVTGPGTTSNTGLTGDGNVTMTIDGTAWRSSKSGDHAQLSSNVLGISTVGSAGGTHVLILTVSGVTGPGTFSLNYGTPGNAIISDPTSGWGTGFPGGTGTVTVTALSATHVAGTFSFDAKPGSGPATNTVQVRNGVFDIAF